jgi:hypothetical protein
MQVYAHYDEGGREIRRQALISAMGSFSDVGAVFAKVRFMPHSGSIRRR